MKRIIALDVLRGIAIILMVIYHFIFDLNYFAYIHIDMNNEQEWISFRYLIIVLFLFSVGVSLAVANMTKIHWQKVLSRSLILGIASLLVSLTSYYWFRESWIYFGILHFIWIASWIGLLFLRLNANISLFIAGLILVNEFSGFISFDWIRPAFILAFNLPQYTEDWVPLLPWFAVVLLGIAFVQKKWYLFWLNRQEKANILQSFLSFLGQKSLWIYLTHQPILFAMFLLYQTS